MGTGRLCHSRAFLSLPALSDQWRLTVNEKGFTVTQFVGLEYIREEAKAGTICTTRKQLPDNNVQSASVDFL